MVLVSAFVRKRAVVNWEFYAKDSFLFSKTYIEIAPRIYPNL